MGGIKVVVKNMERHTLFLKKKKTPNIIKMSVLFELVYKSNPISAKILIFFNGT